MTKKIIDYSKTIIYKIVSNDLNITDVYVGSTTNFTKRKCKHKSNCNNINGKNYNLKLYQFIRSNGGWSNFSMIEIEKYNCSNGNEARSQERQWYEKLNSQLNMVCPGAFANGKKEYTKIYNENHKKEIKEYNKIYKENHKKEIKEQHKIYYKTNKEQIIKKKSEPYLCECGCVIQRTVKAQHQKTQKHNKLMEKLKTDDVLIF